MTDIFSNRALLDLIYACTCTLGLQLRYVSSKFESELGAMFRVDHCYCWKLQHQVYSEHYQLFLGLSDWLYPGQARHDGHAGALRCSRCHKVISDIPARPCRHLSHNLQDRPRSSRSCEPRSLWLSLVAKQTAIQRGLHRHAERFQQPYLQAHPPAHSPLMFRCCLPQGVLYSLYMSLHRIGRALPGTRETRQLIVCARVLQLQPGNRH